jgi:tetratricopeptide (TPR) repeat protein
MAYYVAALALRRKVYGPDHPAVGSTHNNLGLVLLQEGRLAEARIELVEALRIYSKAKGAEHDDTLATQMSLAHTLQLQARAEKEAGNSANADSLLREACARLEQVVEVKLKRTAGTATVGALTSMAEVLHESGCGERSVGCYEEARKVALVVHGASDPHYADSCINLALAYR